MLIQVTDTPATLRTLLQAQGYEVKENYDAGIAVTIRNIGFDCVTGLPTSNDPIFIEGANLKKLDGGTNPDGTQSFFDQGWDVGTPSNPADTERYITVAEAKPILDAEAENFITYDISTVYLMACPGNTVNVYVTMYS